ncbi:hypothetical protein EJV47_09900 [Hymenobacter gummosus]|uniref:Uncharacterized protein n=1 Tax=Hymenobacter gummosus TaxID=1776032 RepID=A0A3S0QJ46_9BACT|nr:hypothetical protein [Hymenobacter gummosus]RTQ50916.1 hypothetical protein EJV47_09900 [Hymenobacter gummosus]
MALLLSLALGRHPARAQLRRPLLAPAPTRSYTLEDTAYAVRRLFDKRDGAATALLARSLGVLSGVGIAALLPISLGSGGVKQGLVGAGLLTGAIGAGVSLPRMLRFSRKHRDEVVAAYLQGEPLPTYVRRHLRPEHFRADGR